MSYLQRIENPDDLKKLRLDELPVLCGETRDFLISTILENGGHFAGNLGVVELTIALHFVFDSPSDKLIWDVGHQSYIHKILTERKNLLHTIRTANGISGFPKISENIHDSFGTGHSSTAISAACGMGIACKLKNELHRKIIAVVGDGALTGGMSFEALNNLASTNANILVIINDNHIGIDANTGALDQHLQDIEFASSNFFQNLGLKYSGPIDGHDVELLVQKFQEIKSNTGPEVLHIRTVKGKGYEPAVQAQTKYHSTTRYVKIKPELDNDSEKWQDVFAKALLQLAEAHDNIVGITPAMPSGSGMILPMEKFPERFFDVGIAEQHAVTFAAGLATEGFVPYLNIYSTFLQRGFDQLIHDVALQELHVVFCIDRAGLVGEDGPTHHGTFDIAYLKSIPEIIVTAPRNDSELRELMDLAYQAGKPFCIRYPKGKVVKSSPLLSQKINLNGKAYELVRGEKIAILSTGITSDFALKAVELSSVNASVFHFPVIKPLNENEVLEIIKVHDTIITVEDGCLIGGFGESIAGVIANSSLNKKCFHLGIPDAFIGHGDNALLYDKCGYSPKKIAELLISLNAE